ncbi:MAG: acyltransferase [Pseudomonadota bacterium]
MKLQSIQMLRAVAALMVVAYHLTTIRGAMVFPDVDVYSLDGVPVLENGYAGVDLFFVISGFIMAYVTGERTRGPATAGLFLVSRAVRIYPPWWLFAGIFTAYMLTAHVVLNVEGLGWDAFAGGAIAPGEYLWKSFALIPQEAFPVLNVGWTLVHEMYFYLVFALSLLVSRRWLVPFLLVWGAIVLALSLAGYSFAIGRDLLTLAVHPMTLEFILGAFAGIAVQSGRRWRPGLVTAVSALIWAGVLIFVLSPVNVLEEAAPGSVVMVGHQLAFATEEPWNLFLLEWGRVIAFGLPGALLVYGLASLEAEDRLKGWTPLVRIGDWSYALYLSHIIVLVALARLFPILQARLGLPEWTALTEQSIWGAAAFSTLAITACLITAWLAYTLFERPVMALYGRLRRNWSGGGRARLAPAPLAARVW